MASKALINEGQHGQEAEALVRRIFARLGVADFIYVAPSVAKGNALREPSGDGLIIAGQKGAVIQVKAREPAKALTDSDERTRKWVQKQAAAAQKQGLGSKRELTRRVTEGNPLTVHPLRSLELNQVRRERYSIEVTQDVSTWPTIVVIDHPKSDNIDLGFSPNTIWITLGDWTELHRRLRSTNALLRYIDRVFEAQLHVPLGNEHVRYEALRKADEEYAQSTPGYEPYLSHQTEYDSLGTDIFHDVLNKVWEDNGTIPWQSASQYREIVEFLDSVPPTIQSIVGRWILTKREALTKGETWASGLVRLGDNRLVYACANSSLWENEHDWLSELYGLSMLRHGQALSSGASESTVTLCIGVLVESQGRGVQYTFLLLRSKEAYEPFPDDIKPYLERRHGIYNHKLGVVSSTSA